MGWRDLHDRFHFSREWKWRFWRCHVSRSLQGFVYHECSRVHAHHCWPFMFWHLWHKARIRVDDQGVRGPDRDILRVRVDFRADRDHRIRCHAEALPGDNGLAPGYSRTWWRRDRHGARDFIFPEGIQERESVIDNSHFASDQQHSSHRCWCLPVRSKHCHHLYLRARRRDPPSKHNAPRQVPALIFYQAQVFNIRFFHLEYLSIYDEVKAHAIKKGSDHSVLINGIHFIEQLS